MKLTGRGRAVFVVLAALVFLAVTAGGLYAAVRLYRHYHRADPAPAVYTPPPDPSEPGLHIRFQQGDLLDYERPLPELLGAGYDKGRVTLLVEKSEYRLTVLYDGRPVKQYPVVLGSNPVDDKLREGDGCTPEGFFTVQDLYPSDRYYRFLWIDYPTADSWRKHDRAVADGAIPAGSPIGGEFGIHCEKDSDVDHMVNCTAGCVALKKWDMGEVYDACRVGTVVEIRH